MFEYSRNIVTIDKAALKNNYRVLKSKVGEKTTLLAMVKADAYGHGMIDSAKAFAEAGCSTFGVAEIGEGIELRKSGIKGEILIFVGVKKEAIPSLFTYGLTPVIFLEEDLKLISEQAELNKTVKSVHLKVDTGMSRLGFFPDEIIDIVKKSKRLPGVRVDGIVSHLARADEKEAQSNRAAFEKFAELITQLKNEEVTWHIANSGGVLNFPEVHYTFSRAGISLYGYYPDGSSGDFLPEGERLQPAMSFKTEVLQVKTIRAGQGISYGHTFVPQKDIVIAVLPIGYEDGFSRSLSNCGEVLIRGKRARVCGRVCMNICMVDVTDIEGVQPGDEVVILGKQKEEVITADDLAATSNTISYEVLCMIGNNNKRVYRESNKSFSE